MNKATLCRNHIKAWPHNPMNVQEAYEDLMSQQHDFPDLTKNHYAYYVNELKVPTERARKAAVGMTRNGATYEPNATYGDEGTGELMELRIENLEGVEVDPNLLMPLKTRTPFDIISSKRGGPMRGTVTMVSGESGAGKTSVCANVATWIKRHNPGTRVGMLQGEMNRMDWYEECFDNSQLRALDVVFLLDYLDARNYFELLDEAMRSWDFAIVDSFEVIRDQLQEARGWTAKRAERELLTILNRVAESGCCLFVIQHFTKGGTYVGSTKIKHLTTGMLFVRIDKNGERFVEYTKNRRAGFMVNKPMYFTKSRETGELEFDEQRFNNDVGVQNHMSTERVAIRKEKSLFDSILDDMKNAQQAEHDAPRDLLHDDSADAIDAENFSPQARGRALAAA